MLPAGSKGDVPYNVRPFQVESVAPPTQLTEIPSGFLNSTEPIDLEIGCGVGWHPIRYATENSDRRLIAIEHTREKFEKFHSRYLRHPNLTNLLPIHADAVRWITHALKPGCLSRCFLLYPNPEPKAVNRRWLRMPFMHKLLETLARDGELTLATNEQTYFDEAKEWAENYWNLEILEARSFSDSTKPLGIPRTHFEKKYLERGEICHDLRLRKKNHA